MLRRNLSKVSAFAKNQIQQRKFSASAVARAQPAVQQTKEEVAERDFSAPPALRLHDALPSHLRGQIDPRDADFDALVSIPSNFERAVGSERGEMLDSELWDEHLPVVIDLEKGHGSSLMNPIVFSSLGASERVLGCMGECYNGDGVDFEGAEWQYWVMKENHFGICDECGLVFYLASPDVIAQMELWEQLEKEDVAE